MIFHKGKIRVLLYNSIAVLHVIYALIFALNHVGFFVWLNVILTLVYFYLGMTANKTRIGVERIVSCAIPLAICIITHFIVFGPNLGFQYLAMCLIPVVFYFIYVSEQKIELAIRLAVTVAVLSFAAIVVGSFISYPLKIVSINKTSMTLILVINLIGSFFISIKFMVAFARKVIEDKGNLVNQTFDLENTANKDALTGVRNRRTVENYIQKVIHKAAGEGKDFTVFMCDIDNFKHVNDTYGHDCGDQVLKNIASVFMSELRPEDAIFRWGGEEFFIVVNTGSSAAKRVAERCRKAIEESSVQYNGIEIKVTITIGGVAYYQGATRDDLVNRADENLYKGKHNGKNQVVM